MEQETTQAQVSTDKWWAVSCYVPILNVLTCVITSVRMSTSEMCLFHARQGLVLFGFWFLTIVIALLSPILSLMLWGCALLLHGFGAFAAFQGKKVRIPVIASIADKIPPRYLFETLTGRVSKEMRNEMKKKKSDDIPVETPNVEVDAGDQTNNN
jgi:uncharacterized membrane protein